MDKYIKELTYVIKNCEMENTYKMCWIRSIVESCVLRKDPKQKEFHFNHLSSRIFGYYWNQTIFFELEQGPNSNKRPKIHQIVKDKVVQYRSNHDKQPIFFSKAEDNISFKASQISTILKQDVSWRFQKVGNKEFNFYDLDFDKRTVLVHSPGLIKEYSDILFELINYRWTQKLEDLNRTSPKISQKVKGTDRENIRRKNLSQFRKYLDLENPTRRCFITDKPILDKDLSVDHVIPWSYLYSDDLWNLVYVNKSENSSKSNRIPDEEMIEKLEKRNEKLLESIQKKFRTKHIEELKLCIKKDWVRKSWVGFR